jgi:hypothetical protein
MSLNDDAIKLYEEGNIKGAFKIAKKFTLSFSEEELKDVERAYESMVRPGAYAMFGYTDKFLIDRGKKAFERFKSHIEERKNE